MLHQEATEKQNLVRRLFEEVWNQNNLSVAEEIVHEEYSSDENITFSSFRGLQVLTADMKFYREQYSDLNFTIERMFTEEDTVVTVWQATGVAIHEVFTTRAGEERNKELRARGVSLSRITDGKIIENTLYWPRDPLWP